MAAKELMTAALKMMYSRRPCKRTQPLYNEHSLPGLFGRAEDEHTAEAIDQDRDPSNATAPSLPVMPRLAQREKSLPVRGSRNTYDDDNDDKS
jgi:hypothetical protein